MSAYEKLQQFMREKRGAPEAIIHNIGERVAYQSPQFDNDDQHIGWKECHGIIQMIDQNNQMFLIQQDETPLWAWVPERFITK